MDIGLSETALAALIGLGGGVVLGMAARLARFCSLGAIEDALYGDSRKRLAMWGIAIGTAIIGSFALNATGFLAFSETIYHQTPFSPILTILGGFSFGYGMSMAGNCGFGALARLGGGDLRSFVIVLVLGIAALATLSGPLAFARVWLVDLTAVSLPENGYGGLLELAGIPLFLTGTIAGLSFLGLGLSQPDLRHDISAIGWSIAVGLAIVSAWAGTQWIADTGFAALSVASHTYSAPIGDTLLYIMTASGGGLSFGVGSVAGVILGAFLGSLFKGHFRWEACEDPRELRRQIFGAALMGVGAVLALGCTVGQGLSAMSVLSYGAPLAIVSIFAGATLGLRRLIFGSVLAH